MSILYFPQLLTGSIAQFPIRKRMISRTVVNEALDGSVVRNFDADAGLVTWDLTYTGLSDAEKASIEALFTAARGRLSTFLFLDPSDNLLALTEDLGGTVWRRDPLLKVTSGIADPLGTARGFRIQNTGAAEQTILQALPCPAALQYSFSVYIRADSACDCRLRITGGESDAETIRHAGATWTRGLCSSVPGGSSNSVQFVLAIPAGSTVDVFGLQVDAQPAASQYKASVRGGVYGHTRFDIDTLAVRADGPDSHGMRIKLVSRMSS